VFDRDVSKAKLYAYAAVFASLHAILCFVEWPWRRWSLYIEPVEAAILGPVAGPLAALVGSTLGRAIFIPDLYSFVFGVPAETLGVFAAAKSWRGDYKTSLAMLSLMLILFFLHPAGRQLPPWTLIDIYFALLASLILSVVKNIRKRLHSTARVALTGFIAVTVDAMVRVTILVPLGVYKLFGLDADSLRALFIMGALDSFAEDAILVVVSMLILSFIVRRVRTASQLLEVSLQ